MNREASVVVELDVFSGRKNPRWRPTEQETERLRAQLAELSPVSEFALDDLQTVPRLGYRGFVLTYRGRNSTVPHRIRVYNAVATVLEPERETYYRGAEDLEKTLLEQARRRGYGDVIDHFRPPVH
jgi:hypothetical protein